MKQVSESMNHDIHGFIPKLAKKIDALNSFKLETEIKLGSLNLLDDKTQEISLLRFNVQSNKNDMDFFKKIFSA